MSEKGEELLKAAKENNHQELKRLIDSGASVNYANKYGETAVWFASRNVCVDCLRILIDSNANLNARLKTGVTGLWIAAANGHIEVIQALLKAGADLNIPDSRGITPLWTAASYGFYDIVSLLLKSGADCDSAKKDGQTCLWVACQSNYRQVVQILIEHCANLELARDDGHALLMAAAEGGFVDIVKILIDNQADVDARCTDGQTALTLAACNGHDPVVSLLLEAGADPQIAEVGTSTVCPLAQSCAYKRCSTVCLLWHRVSEEQRRRAIEICEKLKYRKLKTLLTAQGLSQQQQKQQENTPKISLSNLAQAMESSGFTNKRSRVLAAAADVVQDIFREYFHKSNFYVVGSFGDGLGCNLSTADGSIGPESDIDFAEIMPGQKFHPKDSCKCKGVPEEENDVYKKGHIILNEKITVGSRPAMTTQATPVTPSMDVVYAYAACCYPPLRIVDDSQEEWSNFPKEIAEKLKHEVALSDHPFHLIRAGTPDKEGTQLRVSTSILERTVLRSLTTVQCQFYIILKFIIKSVLGVSNGEHQSIGLKSYHAKSLLLFMLKKTETCDWSIKNIRQLLTTALKILKDFMNSHTNNEKYCMPHFFLKDATLYLKKVHSPKASIVKHIGHVINCIDQHLLEFRDQLKPMKHKDHLSLHIFTLFPFGFSLFNDSVESQNEFHNAYIRIKQYLKLTLRIDKALPEDIGSKIDCLPDFVRTARLCLKVLMYIRMGQEDGENAARQLVREHSESYACRDLSVSECDSIERTKQNIVEQLRNCDSMWRMCCRIDLEDRAGFASIVCAACFPSRFPNHERRLYLNFEVLLQLLKLRLLGCSERDSVHAWSLRVIDDSGQDETGQDRKARTADFEELFVAAQLTSDVSKKRVALKALRKLFTWRHEKTDAIINQILGLQDVYQAVHHDSSTGACYKAIAEQ